MSKDPAFLFYPGDYLRDTQTLSENAQVAYDRIMCEHMRNICISQRQLNFFIKRLNNDEKDEINFLLKKIDGGFCIEWVAESIVQRRKYSESRRNNRSGKTKKKQNNISKTHDQHMENESVNEIEVKDVIIINNENEKKFELIIKSFNSICNSLEPILKLTQQRKINIEKIINEYKPNDVCAFFDIVFTKVSESSFLNGGGEKGWKMNFDWMLNQDNFLKIIENNYQDDKTNSNRGNDTKQGYKVAKVDTDKIVRELADDFENGNIPGKY